jgi:hypothetical protein
MQVLVASGIIRRGGPVLLFPGRDMAAAYLYGISARIRRRRRRRGLVLQASRSSQQQKHTFARSKWPPLASLSSIQPAACQDVPGLFSLLASGYFAAPILASRFHPCPPASPCSMQCAMLNVQCSMLLLAGSPSVAPRPRPPVNADRPCSLAPREH